MAKVSCRPVRFGGEERKVEPHAVQQGSHGLPFTSPKETRQLGPTRKTLFPWQQALSPPTREGPQAIGAERGFHTEGVQSCSSHSGCGCRSRSDEPLEQDGGGGFFIGYEEFVLSKDLKPACLLQAERGISVSVDPENHLQPERRGLSRGLWQFVTAADPVHGRGPEPLRCVEPGRCRFGRASRLSKDGRLVIQFEESSWRFVTFSARHFFCVAGLKVEVPSTQLPEFTPRENSKPGGPGASQTAVAPVGARPALPLCVSIRIIQAHRKDQRYHDAFKDPPTDELPPPPPALSQGGPAVLREMDFRRIRLCNPSECPSSCFQPRGEGAIFTVLAFTPFFQPAFLKDTAPGDSSQLWGTGSVDRPAQHGWRPRAASP
ncbi:hypothetical protein AAFF_G00363960 [Aldrovandia affinis]|uniref:Uncharacterized protein n=1 Tax=Aldrovandia affinis TaxID=143900 RepID=A0AAD7SHJ0_9TELE|nr:hypothetical protein AAFF_G00363960 [Aldrovandia affinis]